MSFIVHNHVHQTPQSSVRQKTFLYHQAIRFVYLSYRKLSVAPGGRASKLNDSRLSAENGGIATKKPTSPVYATEELVE